MSLPAIKVPLRLTCACIGKETCPSGLCCSRAGAVCGVELWQLTNSFQITRFKWKTKKLACKLIEANFEQRISKNYMPIMLKLRYR